MSDIGATAAFDGTRLCCSAPACMSGNSSAGADGQWVLPRTLTATCGLPAAAQRMPNGHTTMSCVQSGRAASQNVRGGCCVRAGGAAREMPRAWI